MMGNSRGTIEEGVNKVMERGVREMGRREGEKKNERDRRFRGEGWR